MELGEKGEGIEKYRLVVTKQSWDVKSSTGNTVNNVVTPTYGARWALKPSGETLCTAYDCLATVLYTRN